MLLIKAYALIKIFFFGYFKWEQSGSWKVLNFYYFTYFLT